MGLPVLSGIGVDGPDGDSLVEVTREGVEGCLRDIDSRWRAVRGGCGDVSLDRRARLCGLARGASVGVG